MTGKDIAEVFGRWGLQTYSLTLESSSGGGEMPLFNGGPGRTRVLVVDDDPGSRLLVWTILKRYGFSVALAKSAEDAEQRMAAEQFELLVTDNHMPREDGVSFVRRLRSGDGFALHAHRNIPVVMISGESGRDDLDEAAAAGIHAFVQKPFRPSALGKLAKLVASGEHLEFAHYATLN